MSIFLPALIYKTFLTPRFAATVTHHTTSWQESDRTDASGQTIRTKTLMYTPYVSFQDTHGLVIKNIPLSIRSSAPLQIGESITIGYSKKDHIAYETSFRSSLLYAAGALLLLIQWFLSIWIIAYSFQRQKDKFIIFAQFLIFRIMIPMATTAMLCMLFYVLFEYYFLGDPKKQPIWVVLMCIIFSLSIIPVLFYLIKPKDNTNG